MHNVYTIDSNLCLNVLLFCFDLCSLEAALIFAMLACQIFAYAVTSAGVGTKIQYGFVSEEEKAYSEGSEELRYEYLQQHEDFMVWAYMQEGIIMD
jgi:hypothetical protein